MKKGFVVQLALLMLLFFCPASYAQAAQSQITEKQDAAAAAATDAKEKNVQAYIELLRSDVRQQKAEIMGAMMRLDTDEAAKFWPIYNQYDAELTKLNNLRLANIQDYARNYDKMTDVKADELIKKAGDYRRQRTDLLMTYYERMKQSLGAIQAARFLQIEDQLLTLIDLQIQSALPIVKEAS